MQITERILSFDMQQIVHGEKDMKIGLSKMIKKNSGGEGQNPLYVALLASFAQIYRINLSPKMHRNPDNPSRCAGRSVFQDGR